MRQRLCLGCAERRHPNKFPKTGTGGVTHVCYPCLETKAAKLRKQREYMRKWRARNPNYFRRSTHLKR